MALSGALAGMRVLDVTQVMAGPFCSMLLADMGADVIKVEAPTGDSTRKMRGGTGSDSPSFLAVNRGKRGIVLNLKDEGAQEVFRRLAQDADVVVENYRPGVMTEFGLDYAALSKINPRLVYASISGYGATGPWASRGGFDLVAQGMSGIMSITGEPGRPPVKCGIPVTDLGAGLFAVYGILCAYQLAQKTGQGQFVDTSLLEAGIALSVWESTQYFSGGGIPEPLGSAHRMSAPYQAIQTSDGYLNIGAANQRTWEKLCQVIGRPELIERPAYKIDGDRVKNRVQLAAELEAVLSQHPRAYWIELFDAAGIPCGPILDYEEVFSTPHVLERGMVHELEHPTQGRVKALGNPVKLSATPVAYRRPAPTLGQHSDEILAQAGFTPEQIAALRHQGAVR